MFANTSANILQLQLSPLQQDTDSSANNKDVSNLIIIGTPNASSPIAQSSNICEPAVEDLKPGAADTKVGMNPNIKYLPLQLTRILL